MNKYLFSLLILISINSLHAMEERALKLGAALGVGVLGVYGANSLCDRIMDIQKFNNSKKAVSQAQHLSQLYPLDGNNQTLVKNAQDAYRRTKRNYLYKAALCGVLQFGSFITAGHLVRYAYSGALPVQNAQAYGSVASILAGGALLQVALYRADFDRDEKRTNTQLPKYLCIGGGILATAGLFGLYSNK